MLKLISKYWTLGMCYVLYWMGEKSKEDLDGYIRYLQEDGVEKLEAKIAVLEERIKKREQEIPINPGTFEFAQLPQDQRRTIEWSIRNRLKSYFGYSRAPERQEPQERAKEPVTDSRAKLK